MQYLQKSIWLTPEIVKEAEFIQDCIYASKFSQAVRHAISDTYRRLKREKEKQEKTTKNKTRNETYLEPENPVKQGSVEE